MRAVVADAHLRSAVAGIRGLGRGGIQPIAVAPHWTAAGLWSRYADGRAKSPDPAQDPVGFLRTLGRLAAKHGDLVVYPASEAALEPLVRRPLPTGVNLPFEDLEAVERLRDKAALAELASHVGFATPRVLAAGNADELRAAAPEPPLVLKPASFPAGIATAHVVDTKQQLDMLLTRLQPGDRAIAQEYLPGDETSLALVVDPSGKLVGRFQERVLRTWPPRAGSFALTESEAPDRAVCEAARSLLSEAGYTGLAQMDLILRPDGPVLLDVNTRLYACLPTALHCGVNLPALWHAVVHGWPFREPRHYPTHVRFRWLEADVSAALTGMPGRLALRPRRVTAGATWAADDPLASVLLTAEAVRVRAVRRLPRK
jgi:predicted ATP-grasp superfamily ATP-dependent carboligase